jgi:hypothetical protein
MGLAILTNQLQLYYVAKNAIPQAPPARGLPNPCEVSGLLQVFAGSLGLASVLPGSL